MEKKEMLQELIQNLNLNESMIRDNKIEFEYKKEKYRVRMPKAGEDLEVNEKKNTLYIKLLKDDNYLTEEQLIETYKKKSINISDLNKQFEDWAEKLKNTQIELAKIPDSNQEAIENLIKKIVDIKDKMMEISQKKVILLQYSIEAKVEHYYYLYLAYLVTEKLENGDWIKCWKTYEEFENGETELVGLAIAWITNLLYGVKQIV